MSSYDPLKPPILYNVRHWPHRRLEVVQSFISSFLNHKILRGGMCVGRSVVVSRVEASSRACGRSAVAQCGAVCANFGGGAQPEKKIA